MFQKSLLLWFKFLQFGRGDSLSNHSYFLSMWPVRPWSNYKKIYKNTVWQVNHNNTQQTLGIMKKCIEKKTDKIKTNPLESSMWSPWCMTDNKHTNKCHCLPHSTRKLLMADYNRSYFKKEIKCARFGGSWFGEDPIPHTTPYPYQTKPYYAINQPNKKWQQQNWVS